MKHIGFFLIAMYRLFFSSVLKQIVGSPTACRYSPSCSRYAEIMIEKHGLLKGGKRAVVRILSCQPFSKT